MCNATIEYAIDCIKKEVKKLKKEYKNKGYSIAGLEIAYATSFVSGLKDSFKEQVKSNKDTWGLVVQTPEDVLKVYKSKGIRTRTVRVSGYNDHVSSKGYNDGKNFNASDKISSRGNMTALA